jgi:hypothetical protein
MRKVVFFILSCVVAQNGIHAMVPSQSNDALHNAITEGNLKRVASLLNKGASVNGVSSDGLAPIHAAIYSGREDMVSLLIDRGADVNLQAHNHLYTPLYKAAILGKTNLVRLLLDRGANINIQDAMGRTPLFGAASLGHLAVVELLLSRGADIYVTDNNGTWLLALAGNNSASVAMAIDNLINDYAARILQDNVEGCASVVEPKSVKQKDVVEPTKKLKVTMQYKNGVKISTSSVVATMQSLPKVSEMPARAFPLQHVAESIEKGSFDRLKKEQISKNRQDIQPSRAKEVSQMVVEHQEAVTTQPSIVNDKQVQENKVADSVDGDHNYPFVRLSVETFLPVSTNTKHDKKEARAIVSIPFCREDVLQESVSMLKSFFAEATSFKSAEGDLAQTVEWQVPNALLTRCGIQTNSVSKVIHISVCDLGFIKESAGRRLSGLLSRQEHDIQGLLHCNVLFDRLQIFVMRDKPNGSLKAVVPGFDRIIFALGIANSKLDNLAVKLDSLFNNKRDLPYEPHVTLAIVSNIEHSKAIELVREFAQYLSRLAKPLYSHTGFALSTVCFKWRDNILKAIKAVSSEKTSVARAKTVAPMSEYAAGINPLYNP